MKYDIEKNIRSKNIWKHSLEDHRNSSDVLKNQHMYEQNNYRSGTFKIQKHFFTFAKLKKKKTITEFKKKLK